MFITNDRPAYRVLDPNGFFGPDDTLYTVDENGDPEVIYFDGEPNEQLEPLNELAKTKLNTYLEKLDVLAREASAKLGRPFVGRPRNMDGAIELASEIARNSMQIMGARKDTNSIEKINTQTPETGKRGPGRPFGSKKNQGKLTIASQAHAA